MKTEGVAVSIYLRIGKKEFEELLTLPYSFKHIDRRGNKHTVRAIGIDTITSPSKKVDLKHAMKNFPNFDRKSVERPVAEVDILLEMELRYCTLLPSKWWKT